MNLLHLQVQTLQLVCKIALKDVDVVKQSERFVKEINFYSNIVPAIKQFERNANIPKYKRIDAFVRFFGSRLSLDPRKTVQNHSLFWSIEFSL